MYVKYRADRPIISINDGQDWTLPEVPAADYSDEIMENAKEFSDKAAIVISRTGGEVPTFQQIWDRSWWVQQWILVQNI